MDVQTVVQLINGCGFPIVACGALGWFVVWSRKQADENRKYNYESLRTAIDNQTTAVNALAELVKDIREEMRRND